MFGEIWSNIDKEFVETICNVFVDVYVLFLVTIWSGNGVQFRFLLITKF